MHIKLAKEIKNDSRPVSVDVSCIVYNHGKYLREALESILMQETLFPVRIIIHDDASTDNSGEIIREYSERYPSQIIAIIEDENYYQKGKSIWLRMLPFFTAKYIAFCEGDDFWIDKRKLQKQVDYLENNPDCIAVYHNILPVNKHSKEDESLRGQYIILGERDLTRKELREFGVKAQTASLVKRNYYPWMTEEDITHYVKAKCNGDEKMQLLNGILGRVHYLPDVMAAHRRVYDEGDSWTARLTKESKFSRFLMGVSRRMQLCELYEYFTNKKIYRYNRIINSMVSFCRKEKRFLSNEERQLLQATVQIPLYAYLLYTPLLVKRIIKSTIKKAIGIVLSKNETTL